MDRDPPPAAADPIVSLGLVAGVVGFLDWITGKDRLMADDPAKAMNATMADFGQRALTRDDWDIRAYPIVWEDHPTPDEATSLDAVPEAQADDVVEASSEADDAIEAETDDADGQETDAEDGE